jgi:hypothetical protein
MRFIAVLTMVLFSCTSSAQEVLPIDEGTPAPFDGVLLDKQAAAQILASNEVSEEDCLNKAEHAIAKATNSCTLNREIAESSLEIEKDTRKQLIALKDHEIGRLNKKLEESSVEWGPLWFAGGATVGVVMSITIFFIAVQTVKAETLQ